MYLVNSERLAILGYERMKKCSLGHSSGAR
jgi:hypothetical protein